MIIREEKLATLRPEGNLVASSIPELRAMLREMVTNGVRELVLDLGNVEVMDSSGIGLMIAAHNSLKKAGGHLSVIGASPDILELLTTMRIHQHFPVCGQ